MPIWFVYRSPYDGPASKHVKRLDGPDTLLGWFRSVWRGPTVEHEDDEHEVVEYADSLLGTHVYGFANLFVEAAVSQDAPPDTDEDLHARLESALYVTEFRAEADAIQVLSDDDELCMAMYWITDAFAAAHPERVAWLLHDDWRLPDKGGPGGFDAVAGTQLVPSTAAEDGCLCVWDWSWECSSDLEDGSAFERLRGVRLPGLVPWLLGHPVEGADDSDIDLVFRLRKQLQDVLLAGEGLEASFRRSLLEDPNEPATWAAYTDWLAEQGLPRAELRLLELAVRSWDREGMLLDLGAHHLSVSRRRGKNRYDQWIFFDDMWASGNAALAQSLIAYAWRWDVLSDWHVKGEYGSDIAPAGGWREDDGNVG